MDLTNGLISERVAAPQDQEKVRLARRTLYEGLLRLGFQVLKLHLQNPDGTCSCPWYSGTRRVSLAKMQALKAQGIMTPPCQNPGKHPVRSPPQAILRDLDAIEAHLDRGGSVGLVLRLRGLPPAPMRLVVFDCDRPGAKEWLEAKGVRSWFEVKGKRGWHLYALLPPDCPDLKSDTMTLNSGRSPEEKASLPGIDIKLSGHVVAPFSPNKSLLLDGVDVSGDPDAVASLFRDGGGLSRELPFIDPRVLVPTMKEFIPEEVPAQDPAAPRKRSARRKQIRLKSAHVRKDLVPGALKGIPYPYRKSLGIGFVKRAAPGVGSGRKVAMMRVLYALAKHYVLSEVDRFAIAKRHFSHKLRDCDGSWHPFNDAELRRMVRHSSRDSAVSPFGLYGDEPAPHFDSQPVIARIRKRNLRANNKRASRRRAKTERVSGEIGRFLSECCSHAPGNNLRVRQSDLFQAYLHWTEMQQIPAPASSMRFGMVLDSLGYAKAWAGHRSDQYRIGLALTLQNAQ